MNGWIAFAFVLFVPLALCLIGCVRGRFAARVVALQFATPIAVLMLLSLAQGFGRTVYQDVALALAVLALPSGLVYVRFLERDRVA
jgi:multisubunit Na+/H+ antiporter MnhF subunit